MVVADVDERDDGRADDGEDTRGEEAAVDRRHRRLVLVGGAHREHADDRREHADRARGDREDQTERRVGADRRERGDAEDDRRDQRDLVALEQVGRHAGAVADVVAHVVGDRRRVARVVLGDAGLDLADEVGADVGRLREDAAADAQEQREQRTTEPEADEDRGGGVLEDHDDDRRAEQAEADGEHAGDAAGAERDLERGGQRARFAAAAVRTLPRTARLMPMKPVSPDRKQPGDERERAEDAGLRRTTSAASRRRFRASAPRST